MRSEEADKIADRLTELAVAYYAGTPLVSDAAFDALEDKLREMAPDHPRFQVVGAANWRDLVA
jgi:DNA ligase (NAD+)